MKWKHLNNKEKMYYLIRTICIVFGYLPQEIGNWATDKLNKSYYK